MKPGTACELNLDGIIGPTHNYAGLAFGNLASQANRLATSNPKEAALQGLAKMKLLADLGVPQGVLPPQERPDLHALRRLGFGGRDSEVISAVARHAPQLLTACCSASSMWAANAATVSPSADTADGRVHFTPANLVSQFHRSLEPSATSRILRAIFRDPDCFAHHDPLPGSPLFGDEGAANHTRMCLDYDQPGVELFVYGRAAIDGPDAGPRRFPARQTLEASKAVARLHTLADQRALFVRQSADAIDAGAFHNDVVAVGNLNLLFCHGGAFTGATGDIYRIRHAFAVATGGELEVIEVPEQAVPMSDAVGSYLFNSQLVRRPDVTVSLIAPVECAERTTVRAYLDSLVGDCRPIASVHYVDVRQSMKNGGGPACLRLRVALSSAELTRVNPGILLTPALHERLTSWINSHYRDRLSPEDLADPHLIDENRTALDELTRLLDVGSIYPFQL